ncbi:hypothetical protein R5L02_21045, partial [Acinetobacter baumannii]|nr:hypothetical protein [Acinetobacter baumannii]
IADYSFVDHGKLNNGILIHRSGSANDEDPTKFIITPLQIADYSFVDHGKLNNGILIHRSGSANDEDPTKF